MALIPKNRYPGQVDPSDTVSYPHGKAQNVTSPGDGTGTPWEQDLVNDIFGFQQALLDAAGIHPSGVPDRVGDSQYLDAIKRLMHKVYAGLHAFQIDMAGVTSAGSTVLPWANQLPSSEGYVPVSNALNTQRAGDFEVSASFEVSGDPGWVLFAFAVDGAVVNTSPIGVQLSASLRPVHMGTFVRLGSAGLITLRCNTFVGTSDVYIENAKFLIKEL